MKTAPAFDTWAPQFARAVYQVFTAVPSALADWRSSEGLRWLFVFKITCVAFVTLWLAYRLELDSPSTAVTTAFIVALPSSGMVLEKAFFRIIGTLVGCVAAVILVALMPQAAPLLFVCLAIWVGLCTCGAAVFRNSKSYGFLLAGYTACMIAIPAVDLPSQIFTLAITRVTEVSLGILCSAFISDALFPRHQSDQALQAVRGRYDRFVALCRETLENKLSPAEVELTHLKFAADVAALESTRAAAFFEATHTYSESRNLHAFNTAFMTALTTFHTLHRLLHRMRHQSSAMVAGLTAALCRLFLDALQAQPVPTGSPTGEAALQPAPIQIRERAALLRAQMITGAPTDEERIGLDTIIELLERFAQNIHDFQVVCFALLQKQRLPSRTFHSYAPKTPFPIVFASGLRAAVAVLSLAAIWYFLAWTYAAVAMLMTVVFTALAASSPNPPRMVRQIVTGFVVAAPLAFLCDFFLMVHAEGFAMLALCIAPFVMIGIYLTTIPKYTGLGLGMNLFLTQTILPENATRPDPTVFMNNSMGLILGGSLAWVVFVLVLPRHTVGQKAYIASALRREALDACTSFRPVSPQRFDNRIRDLLNQLNAGAGPAPDAATRSVVGEAMTLLELGHSVINMRQLIPTSPSRNLREALQTCVEHIADFLRSPTLAHRQAVLDSILLSGRLVREARPTAKSERMPRLNMAYADLHSIYTLMLDHEQLMPTSGGELHGA
jgi:uncharacterized membrane protein YccC